MILKVAPARKRKYDVGEGLIDMGYFTGVNQIPKMVHGSPGW